MADVIICPQCQRRLHLPDEYRGKEVRCPSCRNTFASMPAAERPEEAEIPFVIPVEVPPGWTPPREIARPRPRKKPSKANGWIVACGILVIVGGALVIFAGILYLSADNQKPPFNSTRFDVEDERRQAMIDAFHAQPPVPEEAIANEVRPTLDALATALRLGNRPQMVNQFDVDRLQDELVTMDVLREGDAPRGDTQRRLELALGERLIQQQRAIAWDSFEVRRVKKLEGNEAALVIGHRLTNGNYAKVRWWMSKRSGTWKVFDREDLDDSSRLSLEAFAAANLFDPRAIQLTQAMRGIQDAFNQRDNPDAAEARINADIGVVLPPRMDSLRRFVGGLIHMRRQQNREALTVWDEAGRLNPDMPCLDLYRALVHNRLGEYPAALDSIDAYRAAVGEDAIICYTRGESQRALGRLPEARASYFKALDHDPRLSQAFIGLCRAVGHDRKPNDLADRFRKIDDPKPTFDTIAGEWQEGRDIEGLEVLAPAMQVIDRDYAPADFYLSLARAWREQTDEAATLFRAALRKQFDDQKREAYTLAFFQAMASVGDPMPAYNAAPDRRNAFRILASETRRSYNRLPLHALIVAHARREPDDPYLRLYQADELAEQGEWAKADQAFTDIVAKLPNPDVLQPFRGNRVLARYHTGKLLSAYRDIGPRSETFAQLAELTLQKKDYNALQSLLDAHRGNEPDDVELFRYTYRMHIEEKRFDEAASEFKVALTKEPVQYRRHGLLSDFLNRMATAGKALEGYQTAPDASEAFGILTRYLQYDKQKAEVLAKLVDAHRAKHPEDPRLAVFAAERFIKEQAWNKAAATLKPWLTKAPEDLQGHINERYRFARYKAGQGLAAYEEAPDHDDAFHDLVGYFLDDKNGADAEKLINKHLLTAPKAEPDAIFQMMRARIFRGRHADARKFLDEARDLQTEEYARRYYVFQYLRDMINVGKGMDAYRDAPDRSAAFEALAQHLLNKKSEAELKALLEEHVALPRSEEDPIYWNYKAEYHLLRNEPNEAADHFSRAMTLAGRDHRGRIWRFSWQKAMLKAHKIHVVYARAGSKRLALEQLGQLCLQEKDAKQLTLLIALHRQAMLNDPNIAVWECEAAWLRKDYAGVIKLLDEHRADVLASPHYRWKYENQRVRCLVRLKRTDEAVREAENVKKSGRWPGTTVVLAHAANGDLPKTLAALAEFKTNPYQIRNCYQDEDLGPLLRSDAFKSVREKYPEPQGLDDDGDDD